MADRPRVVVIGGGIAGLTAAHRLGKGGADVVLVESSAQLGGLGTFFRSGDAWVERFYHCVMPTDDALLPLLDELGLGDQVQWRRTTMGMAVAGTRYPFNTALDLLRFRPLPFLDRIRLGAVSLLLRRLGRGEDLDDVRTEDWLRGLYGDRIWERVWEPLFRSKFGPAVGDVPALYLWQRLGRESNVAVRGYPRGGYRSIIDALRAAIESAGGEVRTSAPVAGLRQRGDEVRVELADGEVLSADWVVSTAPLPLLRQITADAPELADALPDVRLQYQGVVNAVFFLRRPLDDRYWMPVIGSGTEFDGVVEMSSLSGPETYGGRHLAYTMKYTDRTSELFLDDDEAIAARWTDQLLELFRDLPLRREDVLEVSVFKAPFVEPAYPLGYGRMKPGIAVGDTRLLLATTSQVYPRVTAWNSSVALADQVVGHLWERIGARTPLAGPR
ncbi:NAD(P)/FAD-dependent oxidoreductase [Modestobacter sp. URMC 112]